MAAVDFSTQPVFTLITTFIFAPFFAGRLAENAVDGQALWGFATGTAGLAIALMSPVLGAVADAAGQQKPSIAVFSLFIVCGCTALSFAVPGAPYAVPLAMLAFALATIGANRDGLHQCDDAGLVPAHQLGRLSGTGWAIGYVGGLISCRPDAGSVCRKPGNGKDHAGLSPVFGLDPATSRGRRASGPLSALWYLVFVLPLFLFTPDAPRLQPVVAAVSATAALKATILSAASHREHLHLSARAYGLRRRPCRPVRLRRYLRDGHLRLVDDGDRSRQFMVVLPANRSCCSSTPSLLLEKIAVASIKCWRRSTSSARRPVIIIVTDTANGEQRLVEAKDIATDP